MNSDQETAGFVFTSSKSIADKDDDASTSNNSASELPERFANTEIINANHLSEVNEIESTVYGDDIHMTSVLEPQGERIDYMEEHQTSYCRCSGPDTLCTADNVQASLNHIDTKLSSPAIFIDNADRQLDVVGGSSLPLVHGALRSPDLPATSHNFPPEFGFYDVTEPDENLEVLQTYPVSIDSNALHSSSISDRLISVKPTDLTGENFELSSTTAVVHYGQDVFEEPTSAPTTHPNELSGEVGHASDAPIYTIDINQGWETGKITSELRGGLDTNRGEIGLDAARSETEMEIDDEHDFTILLQDGSNANVGEDGPF